MKFYEVLKGDNIHLQKTKSLQLTTGQTTGQTTVLSYPSLMVPPMVEVIPFSWVLDNITVYHLPVLQVCLSYSEHSNEQRGEKN